MNILAFYVHGIREATRRPKMTLLLWMFNLIFGSVIYVLFQSAFGGAVGTGRMVADLLGKGDPNAAVEFITRSGPALNEIVLAALVLIVLYALVTVFLNGGVLNVLLRTKAGEGFAAGFFSGAGRYFGRFLRLAVYSLALYIPAVILFGLVHGVLQILANDPAQEKLGFFLTLVRVAFALFLAYATRMVLDYARIAIVLRESRSVFASLLDALSHVLRNPLKTFGLYYLLGLTGWAAFAIYLGARSSFEQTSPGLIIIGFVWSQAFILSRSWLRIAYQAGQAELFKAAERPRRERNHGPEQVEHGVNRDPDQPEGERHEPDERKEDQGQEGQRPTDHE